MVFGSVELKPEEYHELGIFFLKFFWYLYFSFKRGYFGNIKMLISVESNLLETKD